MRFKRCISMILALILTISCAAVPVRAEGTAAKTYNYVALGDSIAAGYGTTEGSSDALDPALILSEELIANPVKTAYPQVFGERLKKLGNSLGVATKTTNLSSTAYRAQDVARTITTAGVKGEVAEMILEYFVGKGESAPLAAYHDIYSKYLPEANLISIQLGGNDVVMGVIYPMISSDNQVLISTALSVALVLFGMDLKTAVGGGVLNLYNNKDKVTVANFLEAAKYFSEVSKKGDEGVYVQNSADQLRGVVEAVKSVNDKAHIALIGMYDPYGNSLEYEGQVRDLGTVVKAIFGAAASQLLGGSAEEAAEAILAKAAETVKALSEGGEEQTEALAGAEAGLTSAISSLAYAYVYAREKLGDAINAVIDYVAYPLQYLLAGKSVEPQMLSLNEKVKALAEEFGATYVDVYGIKNECNLDPHPLPEGHKEIADLLYAAVSDVANTEMRKMASSPAVTSVKLNKKTAKAYVGNTIQLKATQSPANATAEALTWKSSNTKVATVSKKGLVTAKGIGTATITVTTASGKKATCEVTAKGKAVYECVKKGVYKYTVYASQVREWREEGWTCNKICSAPGTSGSKVYWIHNLKTNRYRYTTDLAYARKMKAAGMTYGTAFYQSSKKTVPVYELSSKAKKVTYVYVASTAERDKLKKAGWTYEGIAWYAEPKKAS